MGLSYRASRILGRLHTAIQTQGQHGLDEFRARLHEQCLDGKREATEREFVAAAGGDEGVLSKEEAEILFRELSGNSKDNSSVPFAEILRALRPPTSRQRVALTRAVFDMIDQDRDGLLHHDEIIACYRATNHPFVRRGERTSAEVRQDFIQTLSNVTKAGSHSNRGASVSFPAFLDFYCSLTAFMSDGDFRDGIVAVWAPPVALDDDHLLHTLGGAGGLVANLRSQVLANGLAGVLAFCRGVRKAAADRDGDAQEINQEEFQAACSFAGAELTTNEMTQAFRYLDRRGVGKIQVADALRAVRGEASARRARAIDDVFDSLLFEHDDGGGGRNSETLEPSTIARLFRAEAHPDVVSGARTQGGVMSEFLQAFEGGGEIEGRVTRSEWREHHLHVSALIADDEAFCEHIKCVWGRDGREGANREPYSDNGNNPNSAVSLSGNANSNRSRSSSVRGPENARSGAGASSDSNASQDGNGDEKISPKPASTTPREAWGPNPTPAAPPASSVERAPILRRGNERSGAATRLAVPPGVLNLLERVRGRLAARGMRAAFQLLRGFREEDRKGSGQVSLSGFKKAVGGTELGLKEAEMRIVFQCLDQQGDGMIPYELFLRHIRHALPDGRLALANQVFDRMDTDGDGLVSVDDIVRNFRSHAHLDVVDGSREEEEVRREFLESFSVTDGSHKWCTRDDIIWWMELLSSSLPTPASDPRFDTLVRACWGIPPVLAGGGGGSGGQENAILGEEDQSMSVLVTHADGKMSIERVSRQGDEVGVDNRSGDLLMSEAQAEKVRRELASRGIHAVHVHLLNTPGAANRARAAVDGSTQNEAVGVKPGAVLEGQDSGRRRPSAEEVRIARLGPSDNKHGTNYGVGRFGGGEADLGFDHGLLSVLQAARQKLALRGPAGFISLSRRLRSAGYFRRAVSSSNPAAVAAAAALAATSHGVVSTEPAGVGGESGPFLSLGGFKEALSGIGCGLTGKDSTNVFMHLDSGSRGEVPVEAALEAIRGRLLGTRLSLVTAAFTRLRGSGDAPPDAAAAVNVAVQFVPTGHPDVIAGRRTPEDVRKEFMDAMTTTRGFVTRKDFESYYTDVSAATSSDDYFCLQVQACWGLGPAAVACAASTAATNSGTAAATAATAAAGEHTVRLSGDYDPAYTRRTYSKAKTSAPPGVLPGTAKRGVRTAAAGRAGARAAGRTPTAGVAAILRKLGAEVQGHGAAWGLAGLRRALFDADRNKDGLLSFGDLKAALSSSRAGLTTPEVRALFTHLEVEGGPRRAGGGGGDASGVAPWQALLDAVRPRLGGERLGLVRLAFGKIDKEGKGEVSPEAVSQRFVASRHPAVLRGHATVEEVRQELLDTFFSAEGAGKEEGEGRARVTEEDFIEHHANLSFGVKSDTDFRELVMSCWGLGGGGGGGGAADGDGRLSAGVADVLRRANAPRRKFLVSFADGFQCVEDLPFSKKDPGQGEDEASLTPAEERVLKQELFKRNNMHATQVTLLPPTYPGAADTETPAPLKSDSPDQVDRRPAWTWAPMSLSEIHAANAAVANPAVVDPAGNAAVGTTTGHEAVATDDGHRQGGSLDEAPAPPPDPSDRDSSEEWPPVGSGQDVGFGYDVLESGDMDFEGEEGDGGGAGGRARQRLKAGGRRMQAGQGREADLSVRYLLTKLRSELNTRGVAGMSNLTCQLREAAVLLGGKGKCLGIGEVDFRRVLRDADLPLTESDTRRIFAHFEMGRSGVMNLGAFMEQLGGRMDEWRAALVDEAFDRLDASGDGHISLDKIIDAFDATKHPEVASGCRAPDSVFRDFVDGFVAGFPIEKRGEAKATKEDFRRYYDVVSATVPDDGYFELLLRTCWRMPGPEGASTRERAMEPSDGNFAGSTNDGGGEHSQAEPGWRHPNGRSRRYFHHTTRTASGGGPAVGNDHYSSTSPAALSLPPNQGREGSFNSLRESRAAGSGLMGRSGTGPSEENRRLRSALLSRTFDSQIVFGGGGSKGEGEEGVGAPGAHRRGSGADGSEDGRPLPLPLPPPAGGGKIGRMAEGAAWTPGGRRLIPGSQAFVSHLGSGMVAKRAAAGDVGNDGEDGASSTNSDALLTARKLRVAAAARAPPVWVPRLDPQSSTPAAIAADNTRPPGSVSLAQLMGGGGGGGDPGSRQCKYAPQAQPPLPPRPAVYHARSTTSGEGYEEERRSECPPSRADTERAGRGFDWWGGGSASDAGKELAREGSASVGGARISRPRPKTVSDTYKSSLVFG